MDKKNLLKKTLVVEIIVVFIGACILPTINGNIIKKSNISTIQGPNRLLLNENYVNGYWKFDEGQGNIAYDSSGHNYNGTINGATWTSGNSSYALDFDGVNDYVDLDEYAQNYLGFNKTDDLIFDFYFNSTSTNLGTIYSMCHTYGYPQGVNITLNSNGTLEFKVWKTYCTIILDSVNTYNDGNWHNVEIFYNGISTYPTVEIYVDDVFDNNVTQWLCPVYADLFNYAKIGRQANQSLNFFEGKIDEFKITKYPGGNEQNPPNITGPTDGYPNTTYCFTFVTNDPEGDEIWLEIDWGDGNTEKSGPYASGENVTRCHKWEEGKYTIRARSIDIWGHSRWSDPYVVKIGNQPPDAPTINGTKSGEPGVQYCYIFVTEDYEGNNVSYFVDWGDGKYTGWFGPYQSGEEATACHIWDSKGDYQIRAKAKDTLGIESDWSDPYPVRIGDEPPEKPTISGPARGKTGIEYNFTFVTTDSEGDDVKYIINWGDNISNTTGFNPSGTNLTVSHSWATKGKYTISVKAEDEFGLISPEATKVVTITKNKIIDNPILKFFESHQNLFQILQKIIQRLRLQ